MKQILAIVRLAGHLLLILEMVVPERHAHHVVGIVRKIKGRHCVVRVKLDAFRGYPPLLTDLGILVNEFVLPPPGNHGAQEQLDFASLPLKSVLRDNDVSTMDHENGLLQ